MISCPGECPTQGVVCAIATDPSHSADRNRTMLKTKPHGSGNQPRLAQMSETTAGALPGDAARTQSRPVVYIRCIVRGDPPRGCFSQELGRIAYAEIEQIALRGVGAVDVIEGFSPHMLPVEVEIGTGKKR